MTLLKEVQELLERTYAEAGVNLEECLVNEKRCEALTQEAGAGAHEMSPLARTFLTQVGDRLYVGIFYAEPLIEALEKHDPREILNEKNITAFIQFVEEVDHGVQAALKFLEGEREIDSEDLTLDLEAQAKIDVYLVLIKFAQCFCGTPLPPDVRRWLTDQIFDRSYRALHSEVLQMRYRMAQQIASCFLKYLQTVSVKKRHDALLKFRALSWLEKVRFCQEHGLTS